MKKLLVAALALCLAPFAAHRAVGRRQVSGQTDPHVVGLRARRRRRFHDRAPARAEAAGISQASRSSSKTVRARAAPSERSRVAQSPPDGYTLLIAVSTHATNPALQAKMPYDSLKDFEPIALLARTPVVLFTHPCVPGDGPEVAGRARQGEAADAELRLGRRRHDDASHRRAAQGAGRASTCSTSSIAAARRR